MKVFGAMGKGLLQPQRWRVTPPRAGSQAAGGQHGASLIIALVLLSLLALLVLGSFNLSSSNLQAVGNMQRRDEAAAAAAQLLEAAIALQLKNVSGNFVPPVADAANINGFQVTLETPRCIEWATTSGSTTTSQGSSVSLGYLPASTTTYDTLWEFTATATDSSGLGAKVVMVQGVRALLNQTQKDSYCP